MFLEIRIHLYVMCWSINQEVNVDEGRFIYENIWFHKVLNIFVFYLRERMGVICPRRVFICT